MTAGRSMHMTAVIMLETCFLAEVFESIVLGINMVKRTRERGYIFPFRGLGRGV